MHDTHVHSHPRKSAFAALLVGAAIVGGALLAPAAASAAPTRITTTIGTWTGYATGSVLLNGGVATMFSVPAVGESGPIEYVDVGGRTRCLDVAQQTPYIEVVWSDVAAATTQCQGVTTVVDSVAGTAGFMATDGPYQGRYLGDASRGGVVDWDQEAFFGVDVPGVVVDDPVATPQAPQLIPAVSCGLEPVVQVVESVGVSYSQSRVGITVAVTAAAQTGYQLAENAVTYWQFDVTPDSCPPPLPVVVTPAAPTVDAAVACGVEPAVRVPETTGVAYTQSRVGNTITVNALPSEGYALVEGSVSSWAFNATAAACPTAAPDPATPSRLAQTGGPGGEGALRSLLVAAGAIVVGTVLIGVRRRGRADG